MSRSLAQGASCSNVGVEKMRPVRTAMIRAFVHDYPWFHRWMGLVGNTLFVVGSVLFLFERLVIPGTWIFVGASFGLMADSVGEKVARYEGDRRRTTSTGG